MNEFKLTGTYFYSYYGLDSLKASITSGHGTITVEEHLFRECKEALLEEAKSFSNQVESIHIIAFNKLS